MGSDRVKWWGYFLRIFTAVSVVAVLGWRLHRNAEEIVPSADGTVCEIPVGRETLALFFPAAEGVLQLAEPMVYQVLDVAQQPIGYLVTSMLPEDQFQGYAGPVPLVVGLDLSGVVIGVALRGNSETPGYVRRVQKAGLLERWNGSSVSAPPTVDAVSGATYTSMAVIRGMQHYLAHAAEGLALLQKPPPLTPTPSDWILPQWHILLVALTGFVAVAIRILRPSLFNGPTLFCYRLGVVFVFGFVLNAMLSAVVIAGWIQHPQSMTGHVILLVMAVAALVSTMGFGRNMYCRHMCPFGQAQDAAVSLFNRRPLRISGRLRRILPLIRSAVLLWIICSLWFEVVFDYALLEPFAAFNPRAAPVCALLLATGFLCLSVFYPRLWCAALCPTGRVIRWFLRPGRNADL